MRKASHSATPVFSAVELAGEEPVVAVGAVEAGLAFGVVGGAASRLVDDSDLAQPIQTRAHRTRQSGRKLFDISFLLARKKHEPDQNGRDEKA